jgi:transcriptional regulator GlxA family with amidase domain
VKVMGGRVHRGREYAAVVAGRGAPELLRTSDLQVRQIAQRAGYAHHGSFTAAFTRQFGYSPKNVRRGAASGS